MKVIIDYSKWRCGGADFDINRNRLGEGPTMMMNYLGFYCCLGLIAPQLKPGYNDNKLLGIGQPGEIEEELPYLNYYEDETGAWHNTLLSLKAIDINDDPNTTIGEKIELLKRLFSEHGLEIEVINKPEVV